jgi:DNA-directed RNA polymerase specialized sigma24 family protein
MHIAEDIAHDTSLAIIEHDHGRHEQSSTTTWKILGDMLVC